LSQKLGGHEPKTEEGSWARFSFQIWGIEATGYLHASPSACHLKKGRL